MLRQRRSALLPALLLAAVTASAAQSGSPPAPRPLVAGATVVTLWPPGSPRLKATGEPEAFTMTAGQPGRVQKVVNIHNPSIEFHPAERSMNTGAAVILAPGGGHNALVIGSEAADFVPYFYQYGINTVILRYRLRRDGYSA